MRVPQPWPPELKMWNSPDLLPLHDSSRDSRLFPAPPFCNYCFSDFFPKTSFATVTAVTALGQPA